MKGSKNAILELLTSNNFLKNLNDLLKPTKAKIEVYDNWMPKSSLYDKEAELNDFLIYNFSPELGKEITNWWLSKDATTPNWDLISTCTIDGKRGILLVEAKAHGGELENEYKGKPFDVNTKSEGTKENHQQIAKAIEEANNEINKEFIDVKISRDNCYQLSNRIAHAWWLANQGIPVVLMYLGFLDCMDMENGKNRILKNSKDWEDCFINHAKLVSADKLIDKTINCGKSSFILICRSLKIDK